MNLKKLFHIEKDDNVAVPEIHSDNFDELQDKADQEENAELEKKDNSLPVQMFKHIRDRKAVNRLLTGDVL